MPPVAASVALYAASTVPAGREDVVMLSGSTCAVSVVLPLTPPKVAEMVVVPAAAVVARPVAPIVATFAFEEVQVTCVVRSCVVASEYVPVAVNCCVAPTDTVGATGVTAMELSVGAAMVTFTAADAAPTLPLSSAARARRVAGPDPVTFQT
jgi:hypothetical protein